MRPCKRPSISHQSSVARKDMQAFSRLAVVLFPDAKLNNLPKWLD